MIDSKLKLKQYIKMDLEANKQTGKIMKSEIARLLVYLRYIEFYTNCSKGIISPILRYYYKYRYHRLSVHTGISIGINSFGPGLTIPHYGSIVVNSSARFGSRIVLQNGVNISENASGGDHIYFVSALYKHVVHSPCKDYRISEASILLCKKQDSKHFDLQSERGL